MSLLDIIQKKKTEVEQNPLIPKDGIKKEHPGYRIEYFHGCEWICADCCEKNGHWDGTEKWARGTCDWCGKDKVIIDSFYAGMPDNITPPKSPKSMLDVLK